MRQVLIFSGTTEGRELAQRLAEQGIPVVVCVATEYGEQMMPPQEGITLHTGRMDQADMEHFIRQGDFSAVVDATHPYAVEVSENIRQSLRGTELSYMRLRRDTGDALPQQQVSVFETMADCADYLAHRKGRILLTTGSKELAVFLSRIGDCSRVYARVLPSAESIELCRQAGLEGKQIIAMQGPFSQELNEVLLKELQISYLVTKQSGATGGYPQKLLAAARTGVSVLVIGNPDRQEGMCAEEVFQQLLGLYQKGNSEGVELSLIGIGMGQKETMTGEAQQALGQAEIVFGAPRLLAHYDGGAVTEPYYLAKDILPYLKSHTQYHKAAVLFSGDTGFYSGASGFYAACKEQKQEESWRISIRMYAGISSVSYLCARIGESWQDTEIISIHGRDANVLDAIAGNRKTFLLLSGLSDVKKLQELLCAHGYGAHECVVGYNLSYPDERICRMRIEELRKFEKEGLYCMLLYNPSLTKSITPGLPDAAFFRNKTPMTKEEVREVSICKLRLKKDSVLYDIGSGTGSIAIESAGLSEGLQVYAVEYQPEALEALRENRKRFDRNNVTIVETKAPEGLSELPQATHALVGGSGGSLREILTALYAINPAMRVVANAITLETIGELSQLVKELDTREVEVVQLSVSRSKALGGYHLMTAENPVYIVSFTFGGGV
ncbi:MAG: precorrin-6A reductase [Lachnospiraceae bacterium]|nr:precorrin-6A reductase [Lachnospiraceae bacterium]